MKKDMPQKKKELPLYIKVISLVKPYWVHFTISILLSFGYIFFNSFSMWISVDFIQELFNPASVTSVEENNTEKTVSEESQGNPLNHILNASETSSLYKKMNRSVKKLIIQDNQIDTLKVVCIFIFVSFLIKNIFSYSRRVLINWVELNLVVYLRNRIHQVLVRLPLRYFDTHRTGECASITFNDVQALQNIINQSLYRILMDPIQILIIVIVLVLISWKLSIIMFLVVPVSGLLIVKIGQSIRRKSRRVYQQVANAYSVFQETIGSIRIVKAFSNEQKENAKFDNANRRYFTFQYKANRLSYLTSPLNETLGALMLGMLLWVGGRMVYSLSMGAEDFIRYLVFLFTIFQPMKELSAINNQMQAGMAAAERIFNTFDEIPEVYEKPDAKTLPAFQDHIKFDNVCFKYNQDADASWVLDHITLEIKKGEMVAFVGHSGAGKTTAVDLVPRFYEINSGRIQIDGLDTREYTLESLRQQIGIVTQEPILFNETIRSNIGYGLKEFNDDQIIQAAKAAHAWEFISKMEHGLDSEIGERGVMLSGGQKQRLSIARAILKNTPILILDEATSSLDTESEKLVQDAIERLMENRTVLAIAHRLSTIIHADKIVVLERGRVVGIGKHAELLKSCPAYKTLYEMQYRNQDRND